MHIDAMRIQMTIFEVLQKSSSEANSDAQILNTGSVSDCQVDRTTGYIQQIKHYIVKENLFTSKPGLHLVFNLSSPMRNECASKYEVKFDGYISQITKMQF